MSCVVACLVLLVLTVPTLGEKRNLTKSDFVEASKEWDPIRKFHSSGSALGYFTLKEAEEYIQFLKDSFSSEIVEARVLGITINKKNLYAIHLTNKKISSKKPKVVFTGMMMASAGTSMMVMYYTISQLIYGFYHEDETAKYLLDNRELIFLPCVNPDGYQFVTDWIERKGYVTPRYKNLNDAQLSTECGEYGHGVSLLHNFGFNWGLDDQGSSPLHCDTRYRGMTPESEIETQLITNFMKEQKPSLYVNVDAYSNLLIFPNSYDKDPENKLQPIPEFYQSIIEEVPLPKGKRFGNHVAIMGTPANGDPADHFLNVEKIPSLTWQIGGSNLATWKYIVDNEENLLTLLQENAKVLHYFGQKTGEYIHLRKEVNDSCLRPYEECRLYGTTSSTVTLIRVALINSGLADGLEPRLIQVVLTSTLGMNLIHGYIIEKKDGPIIDATPEPESSGDKLVFRAPSTFKKGDQISLSLLLTRPVLVYPGDEDINLLHFKVLGIPSITLDVQVASIDASKIEGPTSVLNNPLIWVIVALIAIALGLIGLCLFRRGRVKSLLPDKKYEIASPSSDESSDDAKKLKKKASGETKKSVKKRKYKKFSEEPKSSESDSDTNRSRQKAKATPRIDIEMSRVAIPQSDEASESN